MKKKFAVSILFLLLVGVGATGDKKGDLKPTFKFEGKVYTIDEVIAHQNGAVAVRFFPNEKGGWNEYAAEPEMGRRIHRQVK